MSLALGLLVRIGVNVGVAALLGLFGAVLLLGVIAVIRVGDRLYRKGSDHAALAWFWGVTVFTIAVILTIAGA